MIPTVKPRAISNPKKLKWKRQTPNQNTVLSQLVLPKSTEVKKYVKLDKLSKRK